MHNTQCIVLSTLHSNWGKSQLRGYWLCYSLLQTRALSYTSAFTPLSTKPEKLLISQGQQPLHLGLPAVCHNQMFSPEALPPCAPSDPISVHSHLDNNCSLTQAPLYAFSFLFLPAYSQKFKISCNCCDGKAEKNLLLCFVWIFLMFGF